MGLLQAPVPKDSENTVYGFKIKLKPRIGGLLNGKNDVRSSFHLEENRNEILTFKVLNVIGQLFVGMQI